MKAFGIGILLGVALATALYGPTHGLFFTFGVGLGALCIGLNAKHQP